MGFDYFVFYTEASVVCVLMLAIILINDRMYYTKQEKQIWFTRSIMAFILYFISDACWAAILSGQFTTVRAFVVLFNFTNYVLLRFMAHGVFMFIAVSERMSFCHDIKKRRLIFLPIAISTLFIIIVYLADPIFWINENNELNPIYYPFLIVLPSVYLWGGFLLSIKYARKEESKEKRRQDLLIGTIPIVVMAFGMIQVVALNAPTFCFGCTIMWLWFYIQNAQSLISIDDLTHLNNRGQINRYMEQLHYNENARTILMMVDINRFKSINDTYGHAEGDHALIIVADTLRQICEQINASVFLGRYGGDEFSIIITNPEKDMDPGQIADKIRQLMSEKKTENHLPYELSTGIGYDEMKEADDTIYECMKRADKKLYLDKQRKRI
ncbi:MAG: GGDEF domain-containing protein [Lachnospiraceae bacterium]|nr:GGDEF domain-containing protein [Lachnospiraceae bacterium]